MLIYLLGYAAEPKSMDQEPPVTAPQGVYKLAIYSSKQILLYCHFLSNGPKELFFFSKVSGVTKTYDL